MCEAKNHIIFYTIRLLKQLNTCLCSSHYGSDNISTHMKTEDGIPIGEKYMVRTLLGTHTRFQLHVCMRPILHEGYISPGGTLIIMCLQLASLQPLSLALVQAVYGELEACVFIYSIS